MNKLCLVFVIAVLMNDALGQQDIFFQDVFNGQGLGQRPAQGQRPGQGQQPTQGIGGSSGSTTQSPDITECIRNCPVTSEYNPVCGTNRVTYSNPGRLNCAQYCGINVSLLRMSPCPSTQ